MGCIRVTKQSTKGRRHEPAILYRNLSLRIILFINFKAIGSPGRAPFNKQPRHVTVWYCLMFMWPYLISRLVTFFFYVLCQIVYILFCLLRNECSVYYLQTNNKHLENSYLGFSVFLSRDKRLSRNIFTLIFLKLESSAYRTWNSWSHVNICYLQIFMTWY